jgi:hypothetical protein
MPLTQDKPVCQWLLPNGGMCSRNATGGTGDGQFCFVHLPLAKIGYVRSPRLKPRSKAADDKIDSMRQTWKMELDSEFEAHRERVSSRKPEILTPRKQKKYKAGDFPCRIDGLYFETIDEFYTYYAGESFSEMASTDQEYLHDEVLPRHPRSYQNVLFPEYSREGGFDYGHNRSFDRYESYQPRYKPPVTLHKGEYKRLEAIEHMRYCIARHEDGCYYAVWVSLNEPGHLKELMAYAFTQKWPQGVTECTWGRYHTSKPYNAYSGAESKFGSGGETFWRIKERLRKAKDPVWMPPNLRALALKNQWKAIPAKWHDRLRKWVADGAPGWYGSKGSVSKVIDTAKGKRPH